MSVVESDRSCTVPVQSTSPLHILGSGSDLDLRQQQAPPCGVTSQPWVVEAQTGQQVNVSLLDFGSARDTGAAGLAGQLSGCPAGSVQYGYVVDKTARKNVSICGAGRQRRQQAVYMSTDNTIEIVISRQTEIKFLLALEGIDFQALSRYGHG